MKKYLHILIIAVVLTLTVVLGAGAAGAQLYVNDAAAPLDTEEVWAVGADGAGPVDLSAAYALTASGLVPLDYAPPQPVRNYDGGGGLASEGGTVHVPADKIRVGLAYYYSENRDSSLEEARLENAVGSGFAFGYIDPWRNFVPFKGEDAETEENRLTVRVLDTGGVGVYSTDTGELLFTQAYIGSSAWLAIHPLSAREEPVTRFDQRRYCGDFAVADLGNGQVSVMNVVDYELYVLGVIAGEMGAYFPIEALKAQAVCARTYGMYYLTHSVYQADCGFDVTGDTYCQAYVGYDDAQVLLSAVEETWGLYLTYGGAFIQALYFAADGGSTLDSEAVFPNAVAYLRGVDDPYEEEVWTRGPFGHRVGMSQWGAYAMANNHGKDYKDILGFYYTGVSLSYGY